MATRTISNAGGKWNQTSAWVEGVVPTNADDVVATATSGNLELDSLSCYCRSLDLTNYTGTLAFISGGFGGGLNIGNTTDQPASKILLKLVAGMSVTYNADSYINFRSNLSGNLITTAGKTMPLTYFGALDTTSGEYLLQDKYTGAYIIQLLSGTLDANDQDIQCQNFKGYLSGTPLVRSIKMGSGTWTLTGNNIDVWDCSETLNLTFDAETSTIVISDTGSNSKTFRSGNLDYYNLTITGGGSGAVNITPECSFAGTFTINAPKLVTFYEGYTYTFGNFVAVGSAGNIITIDSQYGASTYHTLSKASGIINCDYLDLSNSHATGGATWNAGSHSTDSGGNSGWIFGATTYDKTISVKSRIKIINNIKNITAKARIKIINNTKTFSSKARIKGAGNTKSISLLSRIKQIDLNKDISAKARIKVVDNLQTFQSKARIKGSGNTASIQLQSRSKIVQTKTISMIAKIAPGISVPILISPEDGSNDISPITFVWTIPSSALNRNMHSQIQINKEDDGFGNFRN
jgi:hypothetical protein